MCGEPGSRLDQFHAVFFKLIRHGAKDGVGIFFLQTHENAHRAQVGAKIKEVFGGDLAEHHALFHAPVGKRADHFAQLADFHPNDVIHQFGERRVGLTLGGGGDETFHTGGAGKPGKFKRQRAIACDEAERFRCEIHSVAVEGKDFPSRRQPRINRCLLSCFFCVSIYVSAPRGITPSFYANEIGPPLATLPA
jgi:hypothetical protein